jgi:hypothetical protein
MKNFLMILVIVLVLACQATANTLAVNHDQAVISAMLAEPYLAALLSLVLLIATLI